MSQQESRFGFGQLAGSLGAVVVAVSITQPWLKLDLAAAFRAAMTGSQLSDRLANDVKYVGSHVPKDAMSSSPQVTQIARELGITSTGLEQDRIAAIILVVLVLIALIAVVRSVVASTAWGARSNAPFLALAGFGGLITAAIELWVRAPQPREAMRPELGLWMLVGGSVLLLLGALTLGNNRRRPFLDDFEDGPGPANFDNTEHLAYSHGAWVPRNAADTER